MNTEQYTDGTSCWQGAACGSIMTGAGPVSIREAARRIGRNVKSVYGDVTTLLNAGILSKTDDGIIVFPYDAFHVDFMLKTA